MTLRKAVFWFHLVAGVLAGLVLGSMAGSGMLIAFEPQIVAFAERRVQQVAPPDGGTRLPASELLARVRQAKPEARVSGLTLRSDPSASASVMLGREGGTLYLNPYTGEVLGSGSWVHDAMHGVETWHRRLAAGDVGRAVTGAACMILIAMIPTGLYLWWPRQWFRPRFGPNARSRDFNWHHVVGIWTMPLLLVASLTGLVMSQRWANDLLFRMAGSPPPPPASRTEGTGERRGEGRTERAPEIPNLDALWSRAEQQVSGWVSIGVRLPPRDGAVTFSIQEPAGDVPIPRSQLTLSAASAELVKWEPAADQSRGRKWRAWIKPLHTGEAWGVIGQVVAFTGAAGAFTLVWTGLALSLRRFAEWRRRRARRPVAAPVGVSVTEGGTA